MKKLLALVLALVMTLSLATVSTNAAYADDADISYDEAVAVLSTIGVLEGTDGNKFAPKENLTRAQAAKIISYFLLGNKTAEALVGSNKFADVKATNWAAGYVDYCASEGIVNGVGDGKFDPNGSLTGFAFAKMLLVALGYDAEIEKMSGADWMINVSKLADQVGLFDGLDISGRSVVNREQAAQMCLNTIKAPLVQYANKGGNVTINGATINVGASKAEYVTTTVAKEQRIDDTKLTNTGLNTNGGYTVEFGEKYYDKLVLNSKGSDDFERPANKWTYDGKEIGTYAKEADYEYTTSVSGKELYDVLGKDVVEGKDAYDFSVFVDGKSNDSLAKEISKNNKDDLSFTGNGVLTQVFVDDDAETVTITVINTYLAQANNDYSAKKDEVTVKVYGVSGNKTVSGEDFDVSKVESDDFALVTYSYKTEEIKSFVAPEAIEDTAIDSFKANKDNKTYDGNLTIAGTKYEYNKTAEYDADVLDSYTTGDKQHLKDVTYNVYLDQYGYVIGIEEVEAASNYVFIAGIDYDYSSIATKDISANAIFTDGTSKVIKVKNNDAIKDLKLGTDRTKQATVNSWFTYTVSNSDVYTLTAISKTGINADAKDNAKLAQDTIAAATDENHRTTIDKKNISLATQHDSNYVRVYGNDATIYLSANLDTVAVSSDKSQVVIKDVDSVTTGVKNVSIDTSTEAEMKDDADAKSGDTCGLSSVYYLYKNNGYILAAVVIGEDDGSTKNLVYVNSKYVDSESYNKTTGEYTWTREVIYNGEKITLTEKDDEALSELKNMERYRWYQVKFDANGYVTKAQLAEDALGSDEYTSDISNLNALIRDGKDTVLYEQIETNALTGTYTPNLKNHTLYFTKAAEAGVIVDDDVKYVFIQKVDNKVETTIESGFKSLKAAMEDLDTSLSYECSAIVENGLAKIVVVRDLRSNTSGSFTPATPANIPAASVSTSDMTVTVPVITETKGDVVDLAIAALEKAGYTVTGVSKAANGEFELTADKGSVKGYVFDTETVVYYKVNWKITGAANDGQWTVTGPTYVADNATSVKLTVKNTFGDINVTVAATGVVAGTKTQVVGSTAVEVELAITTAASANGDALVTIVGA